MATGAAKLRNSVSKHAEDEDERKQQNARELGKGFLLLLVGPAVFHADAGRQVHGLHALLHLP